MFLFKTSWIVILWLSISLPTNAQDDLLITFTPGSSNRLTLQTDPASSYRYRVFESAPPLIGNQIDLRYPATFNLINLSAPAGWQFQNVALNDGSGNKIASYYYVGTTSEDSNEFVDLANPLYLDFLVEDLAGTAQDFTVRVEAQVNIYLDAIGLSTNGIIFETGNADFTSSRLIEFRRANGLDLSGADDAVDSSQNRTPNLLYYAFGLGRVDVVEIDRARLPKVTEFLSSTEVTFFQHTDGDTDDISYRVECSSDLTIWIDVDDLPHSEQATSITVDPIDAEYERVILTFPQIGPQRFYRIKIAED